MAEGRMQRKLGYEAQSDDRVVDSVGSRFVLGVGERRGRALLALNCSPAVRICSGKTIQKTGPETWVDCVAVSAGAILQSYSRYQTIVRMAIHAVVKSVETGVCGYVDGLRWCLSAMITRTLQVEVSDEGE